MKDNGADTLRFTHIGLRNWRNFAKIDVDLQQRVFLVGPNASGKSNFLDALRFLQDIVNVGGGFQAAVGAPGRKGVSELRCLAARKFPDIEFRVDVGTEDRPKAWSYELAFTQDSQRRPKIRKETIRRNGRIKLERPGLDDERDPERLTQTTLEQVTVNRPYRELLSFLASVRYLHIVPQLVREPDRSVGRIKDPFGGDFLERLASAPSKRRNSWLRRIVKALQVAVPQLKDLELYRDEKRGTPHLRGKYAHWRPQGAWQTEERFSDGTLRLLGLLWAVLDDSGPLLLEEPELSLHPAVVRHVPQMIARMQARTDRQVILSTHSPEMLLDPGIGLDEVLLFRPTEEGTEVHSAAHDKEIRVLVEHDLPLADAVIPATGPSEAAKLVLFGD